MYLILVKYFYYFYFLKKNKKFKFFILVDLIFFLMKKYYKLLILKKKINKYKNIINKNAKRKNETMKQVYFINKLDSFITNKISSFNDFIINFLPTQLLPMGNRKKFYNLLNKKFKRFFILIKKKLNKKFFFYYLVQLFRKIKVLFLKSDAFLNKKTFLFDFFSNIVFETKYASLLQLYRQFEKKDNLLKNKFLSFFNLINFFLHRIDFFLFRILSFYSLDLIRKNIYFFGIFINNKKIDSINYFLTKYDFIILPDHFLVAMKKMYIFSLQYFFSYGNSYNYKLNNKTKKYYYLELFKKIKLSSNNLLYLKKANFKKKQITFTTYINLLDQIFNYFFSLKNANYSFDLLTNYKNSYKIEYQFPFFLKKKKRELFFNTKSSYLSNVTISFATPKNGNSRFSFLNLTNFISLFFFLYRVKHLYYYSNNNKLIVSPIFIDKLLKEQKKMFYYFCLFFHININRLV